MAEKVSLTDEKYTIVDELFEGRGFYALRYGEKWRDLSGDKLIYSMFCDILSLRKEVEILKNHEEEYDQTIMNLDALADSVRYGLGEPPSSETVADKIVELISNLEKKVGEIV